METPEPKPLGRAEALTLAQVADGDPASLVDWVALQHLKRRGFVEETPPSGWKLTEDGKKAHRGRVP